MDDAEFAEERITFEVPQRSSSRALRSCSIVTYSGNLDAFAAVQEPFVRDVAAELYTWRRSYGKVKDVCCNVQFQRFSDCIQAPSSDPVAVLLGPVLHTFWCDGQYADLQKPSIKEQISSWLETMEAHSTSDWLIIVLVRAESKKSPRSKPVPRLDFYDRINAEFCIKVRDRGRCVYIWDPRGGLGDADAWRNAVLRFRQLVFEACDTKLKSYEEKVRIKREERGKPSWILSDYVYLREALANAYQRLDFPEEALWHLDDLDQGITQFVADAAQEDGASSNWRQCAVIPKNWLGPMFTAASRENWRLHDMVKAGSVSLLELRSFLFARQYELLQETNRTSEFTMRAIHFIKSINQECTLFKVESVPGLLDSWIFLACHEVRQTSQSSGDSSLAALQNCATLLGLEREKVLFLRGLDDILNNVPRAAAPCPHDGTMLRLGSVIVGCCSLLESAFYKGVWESQLEKLGRLCGLMPNQEVTSAQNGLVSWLAEAITAQRPSSSVLKLYDSLLSKEKFMKNFLELSEMAMGTFKHVGRTRAARHMGIELAKCYMQWKLYEKAGGFLLDALKVLKDERWLLPSADVAVLYAECAMATEQWDQVIKAALLVVSCLQIDSGLRLKHFMLFDQIVATKPRKTGIVLASGNLFTIDDGRFQPSDSSTVAFLDQEVSFSVTVRSNLPEPVLARKCRLYLAQSGFAKDFQRRSLRRLQSLPSWEGDVLFSDRAGSRSPELVLPCTSSLKKDYTLIGCGDAGVREFPSVKFGDLTKGRATSPSTSSVTALDIDLSGEPKFDLCLELGEVRFVEGETQLTFRTQFRRPGAYKVAQLRIFYVESFQFAVPVENYPVFEIRSELPVCCVESSSASNWTNVPSPFRLSVAGVLPLGNVPFSLIAEDPAVTLTDLNNNPLGERCSLAATGNHEFRFNVTCDSVDESKEVMLTCQFAWMAEPARYSFAFSSPLLVEKSVHFVPTGTFVACALRNLYTAPVDVHSTDLSCKEASIPFTFLTSSWKSFTVRPSETVRLIWSTTERLSAPVFFQLEAVYRKADQESGEDSTLMSDFSAGMFGTMRIRILLALPAPDSSSLHVSESITVEYHVHAEKVPENLPLLYYQLRYDTGFWHSSDETSGSLNITGNSRSVIKCQTTALKAGTVAVPTMRIFYLKDEEIIPMDAFHVYNESTCRTVQVINRHHEVLPDDSGLSPRTASSTVHGHQTGDIHVKS